MGRTERRPAEECERLAKEMLSSGKTGKEWCLENGVKYSTFRDWLGKYKRGEQESEAVWIEVLKKGGAPALTSSGVEVHMVAIS